jgi:UDP-N-acetylmuramate--alanine ligase
MDISINGITVRHIHFVGIKGVAMTSLALYAVGKGIKVTGSDVAETFPTDEVLKRNGISVSTGFDPDSRDISSSDMVIYTGAHQGRENPQVVRALEKGIPHMAHGQALGAFMQNYRQVSVAGCHGKTTVTAMTATIHAKAGMDSSYTAGCGGICPIGDPGHAGAGAWFISEADEYVTDPGHDHTPRFMWQHPEVLVVTNIGYDHPDVYPELSDIQLVMKSFAQSVPAAGTVIINADDEHSAGLSGLPGVKTVGFSASADYRISGVTVSGEHTLFSITSGHKNIARFTLRIPGRHNVINAAMAAAAGVHSGVTWADTVAGLQAYCGAKRRFELIKKSGDVSFYDDYAHHPDEIAATVSAIRSWYPARELTVIFEPHTFSRTKALLREFAASFDGCDRVVITDIYASAREKDTMGITSRDLVALASTYAREVLYAPRAGDVYKALLPTLGKKGIYVFMGAGDIYTWGKDVAMKLAKRSTEGRKK